MFRTAIALLPLLLLTASAARAATDPVELIRAADRSRGGASTGLSWSAEVESVEDGDQSTRGYQIRVRNRDALVETVSPARNKGELMLFNSDDLWFHKPGLRKPVPLSRRQRLSGQAANGDIASTDYAGSYAVTAAGEEPIDGEAAYKFELKSKSPAATYDRIRYWVSKSRSVALRADFLTLQGEVFKSATFKYENQRQGHPFVSEMRITDGTSKANYSVIRYREVVERPLSAALFNVNSLSR